MTTAKKDPTIAELIRAIAAVNGHPAPDEYVEAVIAAVEQNRKGDK